MLAGRNGVDVDEFDNQLNDPGQYDNPQDPASLSVVEHLRALSIRGKLTLLYVAGVIVFVLWTLDWVSQSVARSLCKLSLDYLLFWVRRTKGIGPGGWLLDTQAHFILSPFTTKAHHDG